MTARTRAISRRVLIAGLPAVALSGLAIVPARASSRVVYLMRGALGFMFSTGLDGLAAELQARGISTWLGSYIEAVAVRAMIEKDLRAGIRVGIVGHSLGGNAAIADGEGAALIVTIDPTPSVGARPAHVGRLINFRSTLGGLGGGCPAGASEDHPLAIDHVSMAGASVVHRTVIAAALGM